jgi:hypothetical protein
MSWERERTAFVMAEARGMPFLEWHLPGVKLPVHYLELELIADCELISNPSRRTHW